MRAVFGLVALDSGEVLWRGASVGPAERARFGYMPEERGLYPRMRVRERLVYLGRLSGRSRSQIGRTVDTWLERRRAPRSDPRPIRRHPLPWRRTRLVVPASGGSCRFRRRARARMNGIKQAWYVAVRETGERLRSPVYYLSLALMAVVVGSAIVLPSVLGNGADTRHVGMASPVRSSW